MANREPKGPKHLMRPKNAPVERSFIGTVIEDLQELTASEMEHELRVDAEVVR